jgi:hypothetical protein
VQAVYTEPDAKFWLALSDWDCGFVYECQFTNKSRNWDTKAGYDVIYEESRPVRAFHVSGADEDQITALLFNSEGSYVFYGLHVRGVGKSRVLPDTSCMFFLFKYRDTRFIRATLR